jgi:phage tail-like protein
MFEGTLNDLEGRAVERRTLLAPRAAPAEVLPWLASFLGLALDERWSADVRRTLLAELTWLFRFRGTVPGLTRFLEICLGVKPVIIEHFRLRGMAILGNEGTAPSAPIVGVGFRVGGAVTESASAPTTDLTTQDAFTTHAHRFTVIIPAELTADELDMVNDLLETHRPAHTIFDLCSVTSGMRVGLGLHLELTSIIGRSGGFRSAEVGSAVLGRGTIVGRPGTGMPLGPTRLGRDSRIG